MLKYYIKIFYILLLVSWPAYAQFDSNNVSINNNGAPNSSAESLKFRFLQNNFYYNYDNDSFMLNPAESAFAPSGYVPGPSLYMDFYRTQQNGKDDFNDIKLSMALRKQIDLNNNMSLVQQVLGFAQTATVGYLAYRHIKKYGFK